MFETLLDTLRLTYQPRPTAKRRAALKVNLMVWLVGRKKRNIPDLPQRVQRYQLAINHLSDTVDLVIAEDGPHLSFSDSLGSQTYRELCLGTLWFDGDPGIDRLISESLLEPQ